MINSCLLLPMWRKFCTFVVSNRATMKQKYIYLFFLLMFLPFMVYADVSPETLAKRAKRKNLTIREWNTDAKAKTRWLDHVTTYDSLGRKTEEIEYATYGQVQRITIEYNEEGNVSREVVDNDKNKPVRIRKYEYNDNGTKKKQYNYLPNGKLYSVKVFEYAFSDD